MINRVIEAFTKPKMQITAVDEFIQSITEIVIILIILAIYVLVSDYLEKRRNKK